MPIVMKIELEVVRRIIRLELKNYENTRSTSGVISILLKINFKKNSKPSLTGNWKIMTTPRNSHYGQNI